MRRVSLKRLSQVSGPLVWSTASASYNLWKNVTPRSVNLSWNIYFHWKPINFLPIWGNQWRQYQMPYLLSSKTLGHQQMARVTYQTTNTSTVGATWGVVWFVSPRAYIWYVGYVPQLRLENNDFWLLVNSWKWGLKHFYADKYPCTSMVIFLLLVVHSNFTVQSTHLAPL